MADFELAQRVGNSAAGSDKVLTPPRQPDDCRQGQR